MSICLLGPGCASSGQVAVNSTSSPNRWAWIGTRSASVMRSTGGNARPGSPEPRITGATKTCSRSRQPAEGNATRSEHLLDQHAS